MSAGTAAGAAAAATAGLAAGGSACPLLSTHQSGCTIKHRNHWVLLLNINLMPTEHTQRLDDVLNARMSLKGIETTNLDVELDVLRCASAVYVSDR